MQAIDETNTMTSEAISGVRQQQEAAGLAPVAGGRDMLAWPDSLADQREERPMSVGGKAAAGTSQGSSAEGSALSLAGSRSAPACLSSAAIACTGGLAAWAIPAASHDPDTRFGKLCPLALIWPACDQCLQEWSRGLPDAERDPSAAWTRTTSTYGSQ